MSESRSASRNKTWSRHLTNLRAVGRVTKSRSTPQLPNLKTATSSPSKWLRKQLSEERSLAWKAHIVGGEKNVQTKSLAPTLQAFQEERVVADKSMVDFFGSDFFSDDWFPSWLVKRPDFLKLCPRYCENKKMFAGIANEISSDYLVGRALRHSKMMRDLDEPTIRSLTKKCVLSELPMGFVIFEQGDLADGMYIVVRGQVSIRISVPDGSVKEVARLRDVDVFGEVGCYSSQPRLATAICVAPTLIAKIDRTTYKTEVFFVQRDSMLRRIDWFESGQVSLLNNLSKRRQMFLAEHVKTQLYAPGDVIYKEGDKVDTMFIVRYGKCIARKNLRMKQEGVEFPYGITLAEFNAGEYFGEEIAVGAEKRMLRVIAGGGGAEVVVILQTVADEIFTDKVWKIIREQHKALLPRIAEHYENCMTELRSKRLYYDVKTRAFQANYQHRAKYDLEYADTVDQLIKLQKSRSDLERDLYLKRMDITLPHQDVDVMDIKRKEEETWAAVRAEKLRVDTRPDLDGSIMVPEEQAVMLERHRPSTKEIRVSTEELKSQLSYMDVEFKAREIKASDSRLAREIPHKLQELQRQIEMGDNAENEINYKQ